MFSWNISLKKERKASWYILAFIVMVSLVFWGIFMKIYLMSIVVLIFSGLYILIENNFPQSIIVGINENGIQVGESFYDYGKIEQYQIVFLQKKPYFLRILFKRKAFSSLDIPIFLDLPLQDIRKYLSQFLPEKDFAELTVLEKMREFMAL